MSTPGVWDGAWGCRALGVYTPPTRRLQLKSSFAPACFVTVDKVSMILSLSDKDFFFFFGCPFKIILSLGLMLLYPSHPMIFTYRKIRV